FGLGGVAGGGIGLRIRLAGGAAARRIRRVEEARDQLAVGLGVLVGRVAGERRVVGRERPLEVSGERQGVAAVVGRVRKGFGGLRVAPGGVEGGAAPGRIVADARRQPR